MQFAKHISFSYCMLLIGFSFSQIDSTKNLGTIPIYHKSDSILKVSDINSSVPFFILDENKIDELGVLDVGSAIKYVPGVQLKDYGGVGGIKTISFRSIGSAHTGVVLDGNLVPNTQTGTIDLSSFQLFGVNKIQFSTGQPKVRNHTASSFIFANVISIHSDFVQRRNKVYAQLYSNITSISSYEQGLIFSIPVFNKKMNIGVQGMIRNGAGNYAYKYPALGTNEIYYRENAEILNYKFNVGITYWWDKAKFSFLGSYSDNDRQLPGAIILYNPSNDQKIRNKDLRLTANHVYYMKDWSLNLNTFYQSNFTRYQDPTFLNFQGFIDDNYYQINAGNGMMFRKRFKLFEDDIFFGSDFIYSTLSGDNIEQKPIRLTSNSVVGFNRTLVSQKIKLASNLSFQIIGDNYWNNNTQVNKQYNKLSPFISISYLPFDKHILRLRAFYKRTFHMPSFNDLYYNFIGNTELVPEEANIYNMGITYGKEIKSFTFETTIDGYYNMVWNKIVAIPTKDLFNWSMQNIGKTEIKGIDISVLLAIKIKRDLLISLYSNFNFNESLDITDESSASFEHQIPYTPFNSSSYGLAINWKGYSLTCNVIKTGFRYSLNENIYANYLPGFTDLNIGISKKFEFMKTQNIFFSLKVMNLLNNNYEVIRSFPMPGRYYQLTLKYGLG